MANTLKNSPKKKVYEARTGYTDENIEFPPGILRTKWYGPDISSNGGVITYTYTFEPSHILIDGKQRVPIPEHL